MLSNEQKLREDIEASKQKSIQLEQRLQESKEEIAQLRTVVSNQREEQNLEQENKLVEGSSDYSKQTAVKKKEKRVSAR